MRNLILFILLYMSASINAQTHLEIESDVVQVNNNLKLRGVRVDSISTDTTLSDASDLAIPTERAVKAYVDASSGGGGLDLNGAFSPENQGDTLAISSIKLKDGTTMFVDGLEETINAYNLRGLVVTAKGDNLGTSGQILLKSANRLNTILPQFQMLDSIKLRGDVLNPNSPELSVGTDYVRIFTGTPNEIGQIPVAVDTLGAIQFQDVSTTLGPSKLVTFDNQTVSTSSTIVPENSLIFTEFSSAGTLTLDLTTLQDKYSFTVINKNANIATISLTGAVWSIGVDPTITQYQSVKFYMLGGVAYLY